MIPFLTVKDVEDVKDVKGHNCDDDDEDGGWRWGRWYDGILQALKWAIVCSTGMIKQWILVKCVAVTVLAVTSC